MKHYLKCEIHNEELEYDEIEEKAYCSYCLEEQGKLIFVGG